MDTPPEATPPSLPEPQAPGPHQHASTRAERRLQFRAALLLLTLVGLLVAAALYLMWARGAAAYAIDQVTDIALRQQNDSAA